MTIGEVARAAGLRPSALRYYESIGLLPRAERVRGRRVYAADTVERLRVITVAQRLGFDLDEIAVLLRGLGRGRETRATWRRMVARKIADVDALLREARTMRGFLV